MVGNEDLLPQAVLRQIGDKLYEKRKVAALEVEQIVKRLAATGDTTKISAIIDKLISEYAFSPQANHRKVCTAFIEPWVSALVVACLVCLLEHASALCSMLLEWSVCS
eukprot:GHRR01012079.1.p1 GENE.GHRR01012079.1~~GHRR01012079.1.p1  ORF type:complete len:108 (+),score=27.15 GHRR01012079.1:424-747(+)